MYKKLFVNILFVLASALLIFGGIVGTSGRIFYPELNYFKNKNLDFSELQKYFKEVANKKGALYAFSLLKIADLPSNTDIHLLGHTVGDILYKQMGVDGIHFCSQDFRNSCSHSIVIGLFVEKGLGALSEIADVCRSAPGGSGAYGMCFHGLGHGILAYTGYDMEKATELCEKTGTKEMGFVETAECVGGVVMEMTAGVHDKDAWIRQKDKYLKMDSPLMPCTESFIPEVSRPNCFLYITPHLWEVAGGDLGNPTEDVFSRSFAYCDKMPAGMSVYKALCYGGFGKEFVGLAQSRDIRDIGSMSDAGLQKVYRWCKLAPNKNAVKSCLDQAINSLYWGGENKTDAVIKFCSFTDSNDKESCYKHVIGSFRFYQKNNLQNLNDSCAKLPEPYSFKCLDPEFVED